MARKRTPHELSRVISDLSRENLVLECGSLNPRYFDEVRQDAVRYLEEYRDAQDALDAVDLDLAEVGRLLRNQREAIQQLERELFDERRICQDAERDAAEYRRELRRLGAL